MDNIKICIVGNSVALRIRPKVNEAKVYGSILIDMIEKSYKNNATLINLSMSRLLTSEVIEKKDYYLKNDQDITIINLGCVDAPFRDIPLWFSDFIFKRRGKLLFSIFDPLYQHVISRFRPRLVKLRSYRPWVTFNQFTNNIEEILTCLEGVGKVVVLGINPGNQRVESQLPQTLERYKQYNDSLQVMCEKFGTTFISTLDLKSTEYFPDGVHFNSAGHELIADRIYKALSIS